MTSVVDINVGGVVKGFMDGFDNLFTSDEERAKAELKMTKLLSEPHMIQAMTNLKEAEHPSLFVSGWRPALGWLCVVLLAYAWIGRDFIIIGLGLFDQTDIVEQLPGIDAGEIMTLVLALLGLGMTRTYEKIKGVSRVK